MLAQRIELWLRSLSLHVRRMSLGGLGQQMCVKLVVMTSAQGVPFRLRWYLIPVRVAVATFVVTLLSFAVSLLLGIGGVVLAARLRGAHPDMTFAYRHIAIPAAATVAAIVIVSASFMEVRHYRRATTLNRIERAR